jgi:hypothetical protein
MQVSTVFFESRARRYDESNPSPGQCSKWLRSTSPLRAIRARPQALGLSLTRVPGIGLETQLVRSAEYVRIPPKPEPAYSADAVEALESIA